MTDDVAAELARGMNAHQAGDFSAAEECYRRVLAGQPEHMDAGYLLGTVLLQAGKFAEAVSLLGPIAEARPDVPDVHNNLGVAYKAADDWQQAARAFEAALRADPDYTPALGNLAALMEGRGLHADAAKCYRRAVECQPNDEALRRSFARALQAAGEWEEAEQQIRRLLADSAAKDDRINLAYVLARREKLDEAEEIYQSLLSEQPEFPEIHSSLSYLYERGGKLDEALAAADRAIELAPLSASAWNNRGIALRSLHRLDEAVEAFGKALEIEPGFALAAFNLGSTELLRGNWQAGWSGLERRAETLSVPPRSFSQPRWDGTPQPGARLLIHADQGFGDTLQFARFLPQAKERSQADVILECQPQLVSLLKQLPDVEQVVADDAATGEFDLELPLGSLPGLLRIDADSLPGNIPYLTPLASADVSAPGTGEDATAVVRLPELEPGQRLRVGLVWQGNPLQARDVVRSCPAQKLRPLLEVEGVQFISLQTGGAQLPDDLRHHPSVSELESPLRDFSETARILGQLDLMITVDTASAHLAGALGRPVWTMLCHTPDWRWGLSRDHCPWYPTMRLFRQPAWGDWDAVIAEVATALREDVLDPA